MDVAKDQPTVCSNCKRPVSVHELDFSRTQMVGFETCKGCRTTLDALDFLDLARGKVGRDGTALVNERDENVLGIMLANEPAAPVHLLDGPVDSWLEDEWGTQESLEHHLTLAHALLHIYGPREGEPLPDALKPAARIVSEES